MTLIKKLGPATEFLFICSSRVDNVSSFFFLIGRQVAWSSGRLVFD